MWDEAGNPVHNPQAEAAREQARRIMEAQLLPPPAPLLTAIPATTTLRSVYVADSGNKRIQVFDGDGNFKSQFAGIGSPLAMCITNGPTQYLFVSHSGDKDGMDDAAILKVGLDGKVVGKFGTAGRQMKQFGLANSLDCRSETELLVGELQLGCREARLAALAVRDDDAGEVVLLGEFHRLFRRRLVPQRMLDICSDVGHREAGQRGEHRGQGKGLELGSHVHGSFLLI